MSRASACCRWWTCRRGIEEPPARRRRFATMAAEKLERREHTGLLAVGRNSWRIEHASRAGVLVDADAYFKAFVEAARHAQRSILIAGWDFHSRTRLLCADGKDCELELGHFLNDLVRRRRELQVHILIWDFPVIFGLDREWAPLYGLSWKPHRRICFRYDNTHPTGGSHHQKIVVVDDAVAFSGGIDLTSRRWDTCEHAPQNQHRVMAGAPYPPFHDIMMAVEGPAARALGDLLRDRWRRATHETLDPPWTKKSMFRRVGPHPAGTAWPPSIDDPLRDVAVGISRTAPPTNGDRQCARSRSAVSRHDRRRASLHLYRESVLHCGQGRRCAGSATQRARRAGGRRRAARAEPRLARRADDADAAHEADRAAARRGRPRSLARLLSVHRRPEERDLHRRAFQDDGRRRRDRAHRLGEPREPLDGARHRVRPDDRGARSRRRAQRDPRPARSVARRTSRLRAGARARDDRAHRLDACRDRRLAVQRADSQAARGSAAGFPSHAERRERRRSGEARGLERPREAAELRRRDGGRRPALARVGQDRDVRARLRRADGAVEVHAAGHIPRRQPHHRLGAPRGRRVVGTDPHGPALHAGRVHAVSATAAHAVRGHRVRSDDGVRLRDARHRAVRVGELRARQENGPQHRAPHRRHEAQRHPAGAASARTAWR